MSLSRKPVLSAAVVGAGLMGRWHADAIRRAGGQVIAVVDPDQGRAATLAKHFRKADVYQRLEDALSHAHPAVVHLCTPTSMHRQQAEQALTAGAHLFVEKPLAPSFQDTQDILMLAEQMRLTVCPVHQFIFQDGVQRLKSWLPNAGDIYQVSFIIRSAGGENRSRNNLNEVAAEILPHPLSLLQALFPGSLEADWKVSRPACGELRVMGAFNGKGDSGIGLTIEISMNARPTRNSLLVAAKNASFALDLFHGFAVRFPGRVSRAQKIVQPFENSFRQFSAAAGNLSMRFLKGESAYPGLRRLVSLFYHSLRSGEGSPVPVQDVLAVARASQIISAV